LLHCFAFIVSWAVLFFVLFLVLCTGAAAVFVTDHQTATKRIKNLTTTTVATTTTTTTTTTNNSNNNNSIICS
jgi:hypothetical protein